MAETIARKVARVVRALGYPSYGATSNDELKCGHVTRSSGDGRRAWVRFEVSSPDGPRGTSTADWDADKIAEELRATGFQAKVQPYAVEVSADAH